MSPVARSWVRVGIMFGSMMVGAFLGVAFESYSLSALVGLLGGTLVGRKFW